LKIQADEGSRDELDPACESLDISRLDVRIGLWRNLHSPVQNGVWEFMPSAKKPQKHTRKCHCNKHFPNQQLE
jgi:hypothetical protein